VTSVIGGSGFTSSNQQLRFLTGKRQPGSAFKPILYAAGFEYTARNPDSERALTPATIFDDSPIHYVESDLSEYSPENYSGGYEGRMRLRRALTLSKNLVAVRAYEYVGPGNVNPIMEEILSLEKGTLPREASVALGSFGQSTLDMAKAYAVFASGGTEVRPYLIQRITDAHGRILYDHDGEIKSETAKRIVSRGSADLITNLMQDVIRSGTGQGASLPGREAAGKTGTTNRNTDAWFVGFTPELVTAVHVGYDIVRSLDAGSTGGSIAAPVWGRFMARALKNEPRGHFSVMGSEEIVSTEICELSGLRTSEKCTDRLVEYFLRGTEPKEICAQHERAGKSPLKYKSEEVFSEVDY
jgi:penicillin-binding protein 1A